MHASTYHIRASQSEADLRKDDEQLEDEIQWSNLIFLPFHPNFRIIILVISIVKAMLGPLQSIYPIVYCSDAMDYSKLFAGIKNFYLYVCDPIYGLDLFLHILHRQVTDEAMKREFLPKSAFLLFLDFIALVPFCRLVSQDACLPVQIWPNILAFSEFLTIYRVFQYFGLMETHSCCNIACGFLSLFFLFTNGITCFIILLTTQGLCGHCKENIYDWRIYVEHKLNETNVDYATYVYAASYVSSMLQNKLIDAIKPSTITEFIIANMIIVIGHLVKTFVIYPKILSESLLRIRSISEFLPLVQIIVKETQRRNPKATKDVKHYYSVMWEKRSGIANIPKVTTELPIYIRTSIREDLAWQLFYHSPTLRKTSLPFQRWLCDRVRLNYRLPGELFFTGTHAHEKLYYIRSGIVQLFSNDENSTPLLSFGSGTVFGDISFFVPPLYRRILLRCLTYCEVFSVLRSDILAGLQKFPEDRINITTLANERMKHARVLHARKKKVQGLDRTEDEGIAWVKRRWWEISDAFKQWNNRKTRKLPFQYEIPSEEAVYHCAKYIGQLVLCDKVQLLRKKLFLRMKVPWILVPNSSLIHCWKSVLMVTVYIVIASYPQYITNSNPPLWFTWVKYWTDTIYAADILVSLMTPTIQEEDIKTSSAEVMFARFKSPDFILDLLSTFWIEEFVVFIGISHWYHVCQFNRVIRVYVLFDDKYKFNRNLQDKKMMITTFRKILLIHIIFSHAFNNFINEIVLLFPELTSSYWVGSKCANITVNACNILLHQTIHHISGGGTPDTITATYVALSFSTIRFALLVVCDSVLIAALYSSAKQETQYQHFVSSIMKYYNSYKVRPHLLKRLDKYLLCHWKHYNGTDVLQPNLLKEEPYDIFWKAHGEVAVSIIGNSKAFLKAEPALISELAYNAKFSILPKNTTIILFGIVNKNVTWLAQGRVRCEYHNENGELMNCYYSAGELLSLSSVFLGHSSLRTYIAYTDCEILVINRKKFLYIMERYLSEWIYYKNCLQEYLPVFTRMYNDYLIKYQDYQRHLQKVHSQIKAKKRQVKYNIPRNKVTRRCENVFIKPDSRFLKYWCPLRVVVVCISIISASLQGSGGVMMRQPLVVIGMCCDVISWIDIILKFFVAYYDERGLLISSFKKCGVNYITRGFTMDLLGSCPGFNLLEWVIDNEDDGVLNNTFKKFFHVYLILGYFDYLANIPDIKSVYIKLLKWQVVVILCMFSSAHFFFNKCVKLTWDSEYNLLNVTSKNNCWIPDYFKLDPLPTSLQLQELYAHSLSVTQSGLSLVNLGMYKVKADFLSSQSLVIYGIGILYWYISFYSIAILMLRNHGRSMFQHSVGQLKQFLEAERVDVDIINRTLNHFRYWWIRTGAINVHKLINERIGMVFCQDLNYYFFKRTFAALDTIFKCGEQFQRQLASAGTIQYFLPGENVMREEDLTARVYVVHKGDVEISKNSQTLAILSKLPALQKEWPDEKERQRNSSGAIFGQLSGNTARPIQVTATTTDYADVIQISISAFQEIIKDELEKSPEIAELLETPNCYIKIEAPVEENPYNTLLYILRGRKTVRLPWMSEPIEAKSGTRYALWLLVAWVIAPVICAALVLPLNTMTLEIRMTILWIFIFFDVVHVLNVIVEFYVLEYMVIHGDCETRLVGFRVLRTWWFYVDLASLMLPALTAVTGDWWFQAARLLRLRFIYSYHYNFCRSFKTRVKPAMINVIIIFLILHTIVSGWMTIGCQNPDGFPIDLPILTAEANKSIDYSEWVQPSSRHGNGCARLTKSHKLAFDDSEMYNFVVPKYWKHDYIVALSYIISLYTETNIETVVPLNLKQTYFKVILTFLIDFLAMWLYSLTLSLVCTRLRELYQYDHNVINLTTYLKHAGLSSALLESINIYTKQLWKRQSGNWLPELANKAPFCLRQDILGALYMHHIESVPMLRDTPVHFKRQLVTRLHRVVIFPGKAIVQEGDLYGILYFIHEGEVEKWYTSASGDYRMHSLLTTGGYFGLLPGFFPNYSYAYTFVARTVVDLVYLRNKDWKDLLFGYPDIGQLLNAAATHIKAKEYRL